MAPLGCGMVLETGSLSVAVKRKLSGMMEQLWGLQTQIVGTTFQPLGMLGDLLGMQCQLVRVTDRCLQKRRKLVMGMHQQLGTLQGTRMQVFPVGMQSEQLGIAGAGGQQLWAAKCLLGMESWQLGTKHQLVGVRLQLLGAALQALGMSWQTPKGQHV